MGCPLYLAMTAAEFYAVSPLPPKPAWMACHFSPYGQGISNSPQHFCANGMLILNDRIPVTDHHPRRISEELNGLVQQFQIEKLLLDLQRPDNAQTKEIVRYIVDNAVCKIGISHHYAAEGCAVLVPPFPADRPAESHLQKWQGQEIWLETSTEPLCLEITENGCQEAQWNACKSSSEHWDESLCCRYRIQTEEKCIRFLLYRYPEDVISHLDSLSGLGVTCGVGLYQEFCKKKNALQL